MSGELRREIIVKQKKNPNIRDEERLTSRTLTVNVRPSSNIRTPSIIPHLPHYPNPYLQLTLRLRQLIQNRLLQRLRLRNTSPPPLNLPISPYQPLLKIPLDPLHSQQSGFLFFQPFEKGVRFVAVDVGFAHYGEGDAVVYEAEGLDVVVGAGLLGAELVAGEAEDLEIIAVGEISC